MSLLNSKLNSIAAIAIDAEVNKASVDYVNANYYNRITTNTLLNNNIAALAPSSNPIFTGDVTAPSFNATSSIKINGNAVPTNMQVSDTLTNYLLSANASSTYAPKVDPIFTGTLTVPAITLAGNDIVSYYQPKFIVAGYVLATGVFGGSYGRIGFTSSRTTTGYYNVTFSSSVGSVTYSVIGGLRNAAGYVSYNGTSTGGVNILTYNTAGTLTDYAFNFYILS